MNNAFKIYIENYEWKTYCTWDDMHRVDLRPPGRGFPAYFPKRVSYLITTASTRAPFWTNSIKISHMGISSNIWCAINKQEKLLKPGAWWGAWWWHRQRNRWRSGEWRWGAWTWSGAEGMQRRAKMGLVPSRNLDSEPRTSISRGWTLSSDPRFRTPTWSLLRRMLTGTTYFWEFVFLLGDGDWSQMRFWNFVRERAVAWFSWQNMLIWKRCRSLPPPLFSCTIKVEHCIPCPFVFFVFKSGFKTIFENLHHPQSVLIFLPLLETKKIKGLITREVSEFLSKWWFGPWIFFFFG